MYPTKKTALKFTGILFLFFSTIKVMAQDPELLRTWYIIEVINDLEPTPFVQPTTITQPATITFLNTTDAINITGFSGCNSFQVETTYISTSANGYINGEMTFSNFSSESNYCSNDYDSWEGRFYWMLNSPGSALYYSIRTENGIDYLDLDHPLFSGIYLQSQALSVADNQISKIRMYPNPTTDKLFIKNTTMQIESFVVYNMQGQKVKVAKNLSNSIDVSALTKGVYFLDIITANAKFTEKFVKK